jgi:hypothetical protein
MPSEGSGPKHTRLTVDLTPKSVDALLRAARLGGLNRTDTVNRSIQFYDFILAMLEDNDESILLVLRNGKAQRIELR